MAFEDDNLIALDPSGFVDRHGVEAFVAEIGLCPSHKKCRGLMDFVQTRKVEIATIHNVDGSEFEDQPVEDVDIVNFSRGNDDDGRDVPMQIQKGVEFDRALAFSEFRPREQSQTQVDGRRIQGIDRLIQFDTERIGDVEFSGLFDKDLSKIGINPPISGLIGMSEGVAGDLPSNTQVIQSGLGCAQAGLNISQAFPIGQLGKCHAEILVPAGKADHLVVASVAVDAFSELVCGDKVHQLGKDRFPGIHSPSPCS